MRPTRPPRPFRRSARTRTIHEALGLILATLDSGSEGILLLGEDGEVLSFNDAFVELWQLPRAMVQAGDAGALAIQLAARTTSGSDLDAAIRTGRPADPPRTWIVELLDGRAIEASSRPHRFGTSPARAWTFHDVTAAVAYGAGRGCPGDAAEDASAMA